MLPHIKSLHGIFPPPSHKEKACGCGLSPAPDLEPGLPELRSPDGLEVILKDTRCLPQICAVFTYSSLRGVKMPQEELWPGSDRQQQLEHPAGT